MKRLMLAAVAALSLLAMPAMAQTDAPTTAQTVQTDDLVLAQKFTEIIGQRMVQTTNLDSLSEADFSHIEDPQVRDFLEAMAMHTDNLVGAMHTQMTTHADLLRIDRELTMLVNTDPQVQTFVNEAFDGAAMPDPNSMTANQRQAVTLIKDYSSFLNDAMMNDADFVTAAQALGELARKLGPSGELADKRQAITEALQQLYNNS